MIQSPHHLEEPNIPLSVPISSAGPSLIQLPSDDLGFGPFLSAFSALPSRSLILQAFYPNGQRSIFDSPDAQSYKR